MRRGRLFRRRYDMDRLTPADGWMDAFEGAVETPWEKVCDAARKGAYEGRKALTRVEDQLQRNPGLTLALAGTAMVGIAMGVLFLRREARRRETRW